MTLNNATCNEYSISSLYNEWSSDLQKKYKIQFGDCEVIIKSFAMKNIIKMVLRAAQADCTLLITGESGVGKEVLANITQAKSRRNNANFLKINCGAIPNELLESELFGYEEGAFTGAKRHGKAGLFEIAAGGTIFLDEIGDCPLSTQVKLLRVLQEKELYRLGATRPIKTDVRIIAATNKNLIDMVNNGLFRKDLFYRLNVINIHVPPLRKRPEDLLLLINSILKRLNKKYEQNKKLSPAALNQLYNYSWPGNIRELENVLERAVVLTDEIEIQAKNLLLVQEEDNDEDPIVVKRVIPLKHAIENIEEKLIKLALDRVTTTRKVANLLGVSQSTIVRKISDYNLTGN